MEVKTTPTNFCRNALLQDHFLSHWINQTAVTVLQYFMDIAMPSGRKPIIFSRLIQTVRRILDEFEPFWNQRGRYDAIIGSRAVRGDGKSRKFVENVVCFLLRMIFGVKVSDANAPYRLMKSSLVAKYIDKLPEDFNIPNIMFTTYFVHYKEKVQVHRHHLQTQTGRN